MLGKDQGQKFEKKGGRGSGNEYTGGRLNEKVREAVGRYLAHKAVRGKTMGRRNPK